MITTFSTKFSMEMVTVHPGEFWIDDKNIIYTLLGTCVSVVLYSEHHKVGGLNHYLLPGPTAVLTPLEQESARYGINAMELLINGFMKRGIEKKYLKAKVFGGGKVLRTSSGGGKLQHVGEKNIDFVQYFLAKEQIPIIASDLGGTGGRKIYLFPDTGRVLMAKITPSTELITMEEKYKQDISTNKPDNEVILFDKS